MPAVSVLGKRNRRGYEQDVEVEVPSKRRSTRRSQPQIYEDADNLTQTSSPLVTQCNVKTSFTAANNQIPNHTGAIEPASEEALKENLPPTVFATPTAVRFRDALAKPTPSTPKHQVRLAGKLLTPRSNRTGSSPRTQSVYALARQLFSQAGNPSRLVGRENERHQLQSFITNAVESGKGGCTYISGPPGTGKSALVQEIFADFKDNDSIQSSIVNCVSLRSTSDALTKLAQDFSVKSSSNRKVMNDTLSKLFISAKGKTYLVLLDEIDSLLDTDCDVLYSLFEWALHKSSSLVLIGIANALDLTDRFLPRLKMRGLKPILLPFMPYSAPQIADIITNKLRSLMPANTTCSPEFVPFVHPAAVQLCGKKIASSTGDLRKAFNLIRRAIDQIEQETIIKMAAEVPDSPTKQPFCDLTNKQQVIARLSPVKSVATDLSQRLTLSRLSVETAPRASIAHVAKLASSIFNNGTVSRLDALNLQQKAVLCSLVANETRKAQRDPYQTPSKSSNKIPSVKDLFEKYAILCSRNDGMLAPLKTTEFRDVVASLETLGLIHESVGRATSLLTPSRTPSRTNRNADDKSIVSAVSEQEMKASLSGPGGDLLRRMFDE